MTPDEEADLQLALLTTPSKLPEPGKPYRTDHNAGIFHIAGRTMHDPHTLAASIAREAMLEPPTRMDVSGNPGGWHIVIRPNPGDGIVRLALIVAISTDPDGPVSGR